MQKSLVLCWALALAMDKLRRVALTLWTGQLACTAWVAFLALIHTGSADFISNFLTHVLKHSCGT